MKFLVTAAQASLKMSARVMMKVLATTPVVLKTVIPFGTGSLRAVVLQERCVPSCAENKIGLIFYRYILTNIATLNGVDILMTLLYRLLGMAVPYDPAAVGVSSATDPDIKKAWLLWQMGAAHQPGSLLRRGHIIDRHRSIRWCCHVYTRWV